MKNLILYAILITGLHTITHAQFLESLDRKVKSQVKTRVDNNVDQAIDNKLDEAEKAIKKKNTGKSKSTASTSTPDQPQQHAAAQPDTAGSQPKVRSTTRYDFIPGERILYTEDFAAEPVGEMPVSWNASGNGQVVTVEGYHGKWLRMFPGTKYLSGNEKELGENYTVEFDVLLHGTPPSGTRFLPEMAIGLLSSAGKPTTDNSFVLPYDHPENVTELYFKPNVDAISRIKLESRVKHGAVSFKTENTEVATFGKTIGKSVHYAIQVQKQRLRFWVDGSKVFDIPRAINLTPALNQLYFNIKESWPYNESNYGLYVSNLKIASGLPDMRSKLMDAGKFSTNGILFAVNSDQVQPQSMGTIQAIAQILKENPAVRIRIVGHTDSDGDNAANLSLSRSRALAVKSLLEKEFEVQSSRLEADGKGESEPVAKDTSKESKALNRRVEFIKI
ncbi:OmpA family protein [Dyadobacter sandarakinus]|uniref:OmpA family protein n=1 Tax=Dyadobacter sandarakinus TaxID=2747268 RepID=A0ABX7I5J7_9BACT|nr:OmpA family protein [Dyadobacter sandarakinus]QRR01374.1 OmpA family protein [Dyadobacter sandarakinus]